MRNNRILFATRYFLLDDSNGAAVASRALLSSLRRNGFAVEALCGTLVDAGQAQDPAEALEISVAGREVPKVVQRISGPSPR